MRRPSARAVLTEEYKNKQAGNNKASVHKNAIFSPNKSDARPMIAGDIASPSAWIKKIFTAKAIERILRLLNATSDALIGASGAKISTMEIEKAPIVIINREESPPSQFEKSILLHLERSPDTTIKEESLCHN